MFPDSKVVGNKVREWGENRPASQEDTRGPGIWSNGEPVTHFWTSFQARQMSRTKTNNEPMVK